MSVAILDVHYRNGGARAACVLAQAWQAAAPAAQRVQDIARVEPYQPGAFYLRELPCLLAVLRLLPAEPGIIVVDGYVWLPPHRPGLGARLYEALAGGIPVVGIAKTAYAGVETSAAVVPVLRGASTRPLYVSAAGMAPDEAARCVRAMAGAHRIPELARLADRLARGELPP